MQHHDTSVMNNVDLTVIDGPQALLDFIGVVRIEDFEGYHRVDTGKEPREVCELGMPSKIEVLEWVDEDNEADVPVFQRYDNGYMFLLMPANISFRESTEFIDPDSAYCDSRIMGDTSDHYALIVKENLKDHTVMHCLVVGTWAEMFERFIRPMNYDLQSENIKYLANKVGEAERETMRRNVADAINHRMIVIRNRYRQSVQDLSSDWLIPIVNLIEAETLAYEERNGERPRFRVSTNGHDPVDVSNIYGLMERVRSNHAQKDYVSVTTNLITGNSGAYAPLLTFDGELGCWTFAN